MSMSVRPAARRLLALGAAVALAATLSATARAQDAGSAAEVTTTDAPATTTTTTTEAPVTTTTGASTTATSESAAAQAAKLAISAAVVGGPFLVGERVPVEVTITNTGDADATTVKAGEYTLSGSYFSIDSAEWGDLHTWQGKGITVPAGESVTVTVHGEAQRWTGAVPVARFHLQLVNGWADSFDLTIPLVDPASATDDAAGLVYGDRNANGAPDAGEGIAGVNVNVYASGGEVLRTRTDAEGRFRFAGLPVSTYTLSIYEAPDGWVVEGGNTELTVDGSGSAANLVLRAVRPLSDRLTAAMRFTQDTYRVGDQAEVEVTLTNRGTEDVTGIKAGCDRSGGEGPELRDVDLGDMAWNASGVTVPAGETRTFTFTGSISEETAEHGAVSWPCDFGPGDGGPWGYPSANAWARVVGAGPGDSAMHFFHDRNDDYTSQPGEQVGDLVVGLADAISGKLVAKARTDADGRLKFVDIPAGPYEVRVYGAWKHYSNWPFVIYVGTCRHCQSELAVRVVPSDVVTPEEVAPGEPGTGGGVPTTTTAPAAAGAAGGGGLADTGASVLGLAGLGALALLGGLGAVLWSRRRTAG
ncbi:SdrD B-like protein [Saccharothrix saharensis]|uniref:SdrD B-like protein n=1 Tax=Saccharothrix saharensis TaxID=571190 RepID=A0A543JG10_9PSEU|nr:SdrD B-like domain-containing protein [Saccharothrix saharensis]TQM81787.1 SdrD B-like protein [Saccharothrix saharensis]